MRSTRRRQPTAHILVAGGVDDFTAISAVVATLPETSYGQIFIEADDLDAVPLLMTPPRVTVQVLRTGTRPAVALESGDAAQAVLAARGTVLADAVATWVGEWAPATPDPTRTFSLWLGGRTSEPMNAIAAAMPLDLVRL